MLGVAFPLKVKTNKSFDSTSKLALRPKSFNLKRHYISQKNQLLINCFINFRTNKFSMYKNMPMNSNSQGYSLVKYPLMKVVFFLKKMRVLTIPLN